MDTLKKSDLFGVQFSDQNTLFLYSIYFPFRDNKIEEIENGIVESVWVSNQLGRPIIKVI